MSERRAPAMMRCLTNSDGSRLLGYTFWCPGCKSRHHYEIGPDGWAFDGNWDKPSFTPSLLYPGDDDGKRCHLFVTNGEIRFCGDCHHELAGQTVPMEPGDW